MTPRSAVPLAHGERGRRSIALGALVLATAYLAWRWGFTLSAGSLWLGLPLILAETWGIAAMGLFTFSTWRLAARPTPPPPGDARVAIVINGHDEPADVLRATLIGALAVRHPSRPRVFVLDRSSRPWVAAMCRDVGATWVSAAGGASRWSGLNGLLPGIDAEFVFLLDADHVLLPNAFERTLGYFSDARVAFVQTPHVFYNRGFQHPRMAGDPLDNEEGLFFDVVCRGKDRHGAAPWCGTSAVVRRSALLDIGGVATETSIDDTHTGMTLHARGWRSVYHPEIVAAGLAPDDVTSFLRRHGRRARGGFELMRRACPLLLRGLTWRQRLHYFASVSHYLEGPQRLVALAVPPLVLVTGVVPLHGPAWSYALVFAPHLVLVPIAMWALGRGRYRYAVGERFALVRMVSYARAASGLVRDRVAPFRLARNGGVAGTRAVAVQIAIVVLSVIAIAYQTTAQVLGLPGRLGPFAYAVTLAWASLGAGVVGSVSLWAMRVRHRRRAHRFPTAIEATFNTVGAVPLTSARVVDLSPFGCAMIAEHPPALGRHVRIVMLLNDGPVLVSGTVTARLRAHRAGIRFEGLDQEAQDALIRWCFREPFGAHAARGAGRSPTYVTG